MMKYLIIGAGGTGGCIGAYMAEAGKDVTLIARGEHLKQIQGNGLQMETAHKGNYTVKINASDMEHYDDNPDVIFVCVKGYSLQDTIPFIKKIAKENTIVIPILNIFGTGGKLQKELPDILVTDGCIYVAAQIVRPGCIGMNGAILRVVFGTRDASEYRSELETIRDDLKDSGIEPLLSNNVRRDALQKFSFVSPMATAGVYYDVKAEAMHAEGKYRDTFISLVQEIDALAEAMGLHFEVDIVKNNLKILDDLAPGASTSMQRDIWAEKPSEIDGLIFEVVRLGEEYGVDVPTYKMVADEMHKRGF